MSNDVKTLWQKYFASKMNGAPCPETKRELVEHYYPLVKKVATRVHQKVTDVSVDELTSMGVDGLYDAVANYDESFKTKFETYAPTRIRGSMLDAIRKADWVPRLVRQKATYLDRKRQVFESECGRKVDNGELAEMLGMNEDDFEELSRAAVSPAVHNITEATSSMETDGEPSFSIEHLEDEGVSQPIDHMLREELWNKLLGKNFTPQERQIMWLYYREDHSMKEISEIVQLSESRVSQMHTMILRRLSQKVRRNPDYFADILGVVEKFRDAETV
jgi:RNA polymerase sigma factor for flagellar operon FliA